MRTIVLCYLLLLTLFMVTASGHPRGLSDKTPADGNHLGIVTNGLGKVEKSFRYLVNQGIKKVLPLLQEKSLSSNISQTCIRNSLKILSGIRNLEPWALRFADSSAKGIDGIMIGTGANYGSYDECIDTVVTGELRGDQENRTLFVGKYCMMNIKQHDSSQERLYTKGGKIERTDIPEMKRVLNKISEYYQGFHSYSFKLGICIPSGCSEKDINQVLQEVVSTMGLHAEVQDCEIKEDFKYSPIMIFVICLYSFVVFMVLLGTFAENILYITSDTTKSTTLHVILCFSLSKNFRKLRDVTTSPKRFRCLNGIRFLSMLWIILGHAHAAMALVPSWSGILYAVEDISNNWALQIVPGTFMAVETFLFISGFLLCYNTMKNVKFGHKKFSMKAYILHRLLRILPMYYFIIPYVFIARQLYSGPSAHIVLNTLAESCKKNWWANMLFINNIYHNEEICMLHTWYLAVDMQLYIGALVIILPMLRWPKVGIGISLVAILTSMTASGVLTYMKNLPPTFIFTEKYLSVLDTYVNELYLHPYTHVGPYVIGILTGYMLAWKPDIKIPKALLVLGWLCAIGVSTSIVYGSFRWYSQGAEVTSGESLIHSGCHRVAWGLCVAWIIVCCITGNGGVLNKFLSWETWIPLGRLTYSTYLVHALVILSYTANLRSLIDPLHAVAIWLFFGHLTASYGIALVCSMLVESPILSIDTFFRTRRARPRTNILNGDTHELNILMSAKR